MSHDYPHELMRDDQDQFWFIAGELYEFDDEDDGEDGITFSKVRGIGGPFVSEELAFETMVANFGNPGHGNPSTKADAFLLDPIQALLTPQRSVKTIRGDEFKDAVWAAFDKRSKT